MPAAARPSCGPGTAAGAPWSWGGEVHPEADCIGICGLERELKSTGNYSKRLDIKWNTREDDRVEGDEDFWLKLTDPEVLRPGGSAWQSHGGSHHVPLTIKFRLTIRDDD